MSLIFEDIKDGIAYKKYFNKMLDKFGVDSPEDLDDDKKKEFFNAVDKGWVADHEESTDLEEGMKLKGINGALKSLATKPEYKKVQNALNGLADHMPSGPEKKTAGALKKRLGQLAALVKDKGASKKLLKLADFAATFEEVDSDNTELEEGTLSKKWQKGDKSVKSGDFELVRGKQGVHTIKKNGEAFGDFSLDTDDDMWVANIKGQRGQVTVDDIDKLISQLSESVEEGVSLSKKGEYDLQVVGKSSVGVQLTLRHKGKSIVTGTKKDGMFIMAFDTHDIKNKLPKDAEIVKKGKWMHIGFKKADDAIAYAKAQGFVKDHGAFNEAVNVDMRTKGYKEARARKKTRESKKISPLQQIINAANDVLAGKAAVVEDNVTGAAVAGTGDDSSTVVKKKKKEY